MESQDTQPFRPGSFSSALVWDLSMCHVEQIVSFSTVWIPLSEHISSLILSTVGGQLGYFQIWAVINNNINILVHL